MIFLAHRRGQAVVEMAVLALVGVTLLCAVVLAGVGFCDKVQLTYAADACAAAEAKQSGTGAAIAIANGAAGANVTVNGSTVSCAASLTVTLPLVGPTAMQSTAIAALP